jgi:tol-pal system protein YbgF
MKQVAVIGLILLLAGCASSGEVDQLRRRVMMNDQELGQFKTETSQKMGSLTRDMDNLRKQLLAMNASTDEREDKNKVLLGKIDELQHQLDSYWRETKSELASIKKGGIANSGSLPKVTAPRERDEAAEGPYKEAFDTFHKGMYNDSAQKFSSFVEAYPKSSLVPNALFWLGESYMMQRDYDKAILNFQELLDKFPKSDMAPKALLSQADAFAGLKDKKSSVTILKKIIELYPKTEEAAIADRKLRNMNL